MLISIKSIEFGINRMAALLAHVIASANVN
jgi:hypothetical protein